MRQIVWLLYLLRIWHLRKVMNFWLSQVSWWSCTEVVFLWNKYCLICYRRRRWRAIRTWLNHKNWCCSSKRKPSGRSKWNFRLLSDCVCKNANSLGVDGNWGLLWLVVRPACVFSASVSPRSGGWSHCDVDRFTLCSTRLLLVSSSKLVCETSSKISWLAWDTSSICYSSCSFASANSPVLFTESFDFKTLFLLYSFQLHFLPF